MHATKPLPTRSWIYKSKYKYEFIQKRNYTLARVQRAKLLTPPAAMERRKRCIVNSSKHLTLKHYNELLLRSYTRKTIVEFVRDT